MYSEARHNRLKRRRRGEAGSPLRAFSPLVRDPLFRIDVLHAASAVGFDVKRSGAHVWCGVRPAQPRVAAARPRDADRFSSVRRLTRCTFHTSGIEARGHGVGAGSAEICRSACDSFA